MAGDEASKPRGSEPGNGNIIPTETSSSILNNLLPNQLSPEAFNTISQLRKELAEKGPGSFSRTTEDVKNTQALISVALKVASEVVLAENQLPQSETERRLLDCLDIVQLLIESSLRGLDGDIDSEVSSPDAPLPFYVWLIIELITLGIKVRLQGVEARIQGLIITITRSQHDMFRSSFFPRHSLSSILTAIATGKRIFLYSDD